MPDHKFVILPQLYHNNYNSVSGVGLLLDLVTMQSFASASSYNNGMPGVCLRVGEGNWKERKKERVKNPYSIGKGLEWNLEQK